LFFLFSSFFFVMVVVAFFSSSSSSLLTLSYLYQNRWRSGREPSLLTPCLRLRLSRVVRQTHLLCAILC
jgi:hypothetical protein